VTVEPLAEETIDRLIDYSAAIRVDALRRRRLHEAANGNPLALRKLLYASAPPARERGTGQKVVGEARQNRTRGHRGARAVGAARRHR
jgi:hypothetical protein